MFVDGTTYDECWESAHQTYVDADAIDFEIVQDPITWTYIGLIVS